jgi:hypothetical protein
MFVQVKGPVRSLVQTSLNCPLYTIDLEMVGVCFEVNWLHVWRMPLAGSGRCSHVYAGGWVGVVGEWVGVSGLGWSVWSGRRWVCLVVGLAIWVSLC